MGSIREEKKIHIGGTVVVHDWQNKQNIKNIIFIYWRTTK